MFADEIADLEDRYGPRLSVIHVFSREPRDVDLFSGRLAAELKIRLFSSPDTIGPSPVAGSGLSSVTPYRRAGK